MKGALNIGKDLRGKDLGVGIVQQKDGLYCARFVNRLGQSKKKCSKKLQEVRQWLADAKYIDEHSSITEANDMLVDAWFEYWIEIKEKTVRPNTVRNYREGYNRNIKPVIGKLLLSEVKPVHCQKIFTNMADDYKTTTIYQTRIALFNMLEFAKENDVIRNKTMTINRYMKYRYKVGEWRIGPPKSKSGYRTVPLTSEAIRILKNQKTKNKEKLIL